MPKEDVAHPVEAQEENVNAIPDDLNWLNAHEMKERWKAITFKIDPADKRPRTEIIAERKRMVKALLRGWLELYNDEKNRNHKLVDCTVIKNDNVDTYFVKAMIDPPQEEEQHDHHEGRDGNGRGGVKAAKVKATANAGTGNGNTGGGTGSGHLVPHPPPPPDESFGL